MDQARLVSSQAKNLGISIPYPIPYREAADYTGYVASRNISKILIDNADIIISRHFRIPQIYGFLLLLTFDDILKNLFHKYDITAFSMTEPGFRKKDTMERLMEITESLTEILRNELEEPMPDFPL